MATGRDGLEIWQTGHFARGGMCGQKNVSWGAPKSRANFNASPTLARRCTILQPYRTFTLWAARAAAFALAVLVLGTLSDVD